MKHHSPLRTIALSLALLLAALFSHAPTPPAAAHPADMYNQVIEATLSAEEIAVRWELFPGPLLSYNVWAEADLNEDERVSADEAETWAVRQLDSFTLTLATEPVKWSLDEASWPADFTSFQLGEERIEIHLSAPWPDSPGTNVPLSLDNAFQEAISVDWFILTAEEGFSFAPPTQERGLLTTAAFTPDSRGEGITEWDSGTPSGPAQGGLRVETGAFRGTRTTETLTALISGDDLTFSFLIGAFLIAFLLGAIHALTPGHGKTLVAAYLVGQRSSVKHAIALGSIVTVTHTGSVILLGLLTLLASQIIVPTAVFPVLEIISGLLIVGMGAVMIIRRLRGYRGVLRLWARQAAPVQEVKPNPARVEISVKEAIDVRAFDGALAGVDGGEGISWRALVSLGISGGLVPCPDAIALLLVSFTLGRLGLGIALVFTFSLGLAAVLIVIGVLTVRGRGFLDRFKLFTKTAPALPLVSAIIVTVLGLILTVGAALRTDFSAFLPRDRAEVAFSLEAAHIAYTRGGAEEEKRVYLMALANGESVALTPVELTLRDAAVSPDGSQLAYAVAGQLGDSEIRLLDLISGQEKTLLTCPESYCAALIWAPDGEGLLYERINLFSIDAIGSSGTLWWVQTLDGRSDPVFTDSTLPAYSASLSPDGQWLSYNTPQGGEVRLYNLHDGTNIALPVQLGTPIIWAPDSRQFFVREMFIDDINRTRTALSRYEIRGGEVILLDRDAIEGRTAVYSPAGDWLAVIRDIASETGAYQGNQIWVMRPDGSEARLLTDDSKVLHTTLIFSPDGETLLCNQYDLGVPSSESTLWLIDLASGEKTPLPAPGYNPAWAVVGLNG